MNERVDVAVVGAGAAGLMAAIWAARTAPNARVVVLEGAAKLGAKILISGGGRCNVTHEIVRTDDFCGSTPAAIRKVLARYDLERTTGFFAELGVRLKREQTGKLFPESDDAHTVLDALHGALEAAGAELRQPFRVERVTADGEGFLVASDSARINARRVVLATGGRSLARTGSDGGGYEIARSLGHSVTRVFPALVPLLLPEGDSLRSLSGVSAPVTLTVRSGSGKRLATATGSMLCTHFGVSGPVTLDISRHLIAAQLEDPDAGLTCDWLPPFERDALDRELRTPGAGTILGRLRRQLPERLADALCARAGLDGSTPAARLARDARITLVRTLKEMHLPITRDRGWDFAEVTAGGVPLAELEPATLQSRVRPGLHLCGEICDVDGRIGGFNFQWAWASGFVAGSGAAKGIEDASEA